MPGSIVPSADGTKCPSLDYTVPGSGFQVPRSMFVFAVPVHGFRVRGSRFGVPVHGSGFLFMVPGSCSGFRVRDSGFRVRDSGFRALAAEPGTANDEPRTRNRGTENPER